jgi:hypothetical protein
VVVSIEYLVRYSDGHRELIVERVTPYSDEVIWVATDTDHPCIVDNDGDYQTDFELLLDQAQAAAWADAGREVQFQPVDDDALIVLRTGDVFTQLVG